MVANVSKYVPRGVLFMGVLVEGGTPSDIATRDNLDAWVTSLKIPYTFVLDSVKPQLDMETYFNTGRDTYVIIDLKTMKVLNVDDQNAGGVMQALTDLDGYLK